MEKAQCSHHRQALNTVPLRENPAVICHFAEAIVRHLYLDLRWVFFCFRFGGSQGSEGVKQAHTVRSAVRQQTSEENLQV